MATIEEDLKIIQEAIYGKDMRPAIFDALLQSWTSVKLMMGAVDQLNARVDNLGGGGGGEPSDQIEPPSIAVYGSTTVLIDAGNPEIL